MNLLEVAGLLLLHSQNIANVNKKQPFEPVTVVNHNFFDCDVISYSFAS